MVRIIKTFKQTSWGQGPAVLIVILIGFALRVFRLAQQSYWWDELTTVGSSVLSMSEMLDYQFNNISHLPFYFILMQGWIKIGDGEFTLRFFSVIFGVLSIALIYKTGKLVGGRLTGLTAALFLAFSPFNIWYSQEARMYSFIAFTILAAHWFLFRILDGGGRNNWIAYFFAMLVSVYSHYLTIFILVSHYAFFSIHYRYKKQLLRSWLVYGVSVALLFSIWIAAILINGGFGNAPIGWIAAAHWYEPILTFVSLSIGPSIDPGNPIFYLVPLAFLFGIVFGLRRYFHFSESTANSNQLQGRTLIFRLLLIWLLLPILLTYLVSLDLPIERHRSLYMDRYLIICLPSLILLGAWGIVSVTQKTSRPWLLSATITLIIGVSLLSLTNMYFRPVYARDNWRGALNTITSEWDEEDTYLVKPGQLLVYYKYGRDFMTAEFMPYFFVQPESSKYDERDIEMWVQSATMNSDRAWLLTSVENVNPHGFPQTRTAALHSKSPAGKMEKWMDRYCSDPVQWRFTGILLSRYELASCLFPSS